MMEMMVTSGSSMCWTHDPLFLINSLRMAASSQNM